VIAAALVGTCVIAVLVAALFVPLDRFG